MLGLSILIALATALLTSVATALYDVLTWANSDREPPHIRQRGD